MKNLYKISTAFAFLALAALAACEDPIPDDYVKQYYVEGYMIAGDPIRYIKLMETQPITEDFNYENSFVRDAEVKILGDGQEFNLKIDPDGTDGYYYEDQSYIVKPETEYSLEITLPDGGLVTSTVNTPPATAWVRKVPVPLQYPKDTLELAASEYISWEAVPDYGFFILQIKCLDTLEYGKYLDPPTEELNRRKEFFWTTETDFKEVTNTALIANTQTSVVWPIFKWFGMHEVTCFVPDYHFLQWFKQMYFTGEYDYKLSNLEGPAIGTFCSASAIRDTTLLLKPYPDAQ